MTQPIHPDIPPAKAWKVGRRVYVRCGYQSTLNGQLRDLGAKWDRDERALWVGSGKVEQVIALVRAQTERIAAIETIKAAGHVQAIPYDAATIRSRAKQLGGVWDDARQLWAFPTSAALAEVRELLVQRTTAIKAKRDAERATRAEQAKMSATEREQQTITGSGRTVTDQRGTGSGRLHGRMRRAAAEQAKPQPGDIRRLRNGQRVLVLTCDVQFVNQDAIDDGLVGDPSMDAGWYYDYRYAVVEPTEEEAAQDAREQAERDDADEIDNVFQAARLAVVDVTEPPQATPAGATITTATGAMGAHDGRLTLTEDGQLWWYHPGYYDDWRAVSGRVVDEQLVARVREIVAGGDRTRGRYTIRTWTSS